MIQPSGFPDPRQAEDHGLVAVGGDFSPAMLVTAYAHGIFPWPTGGLSRAWFSPNPRMVLRPEELHVPRRLARTLRQGRFDVTFDTAFPEVVHGCAAAERPGQPGTWITDDLIAGFCELHTLGLAHSVEAWRNGRLVGGVYGLALGRVFCGESMFHTETDASKVAFVTLVRQLRDWGFRMLDCQIHTRHLESLGAREWPRDRFLDELEVAVREPAPRGKWTRAAAVELPA